jgi:hypothetical protein
MATRRTMLELLFAAMAKDATDLAVPAAPQIASLQGLGLGYETLIYNCRWAAERALRVSCDFLECGVNRGGISRAVIDYVDFSNIYRRFFARHVLQRSRVASPNQHDYTECYALALPF